MSGRKIIFQCKNPHGWCTANTCDQYNCPAMGLNPEYKRQPGGAIVSVEIGPNSITYSWDEESNGLASHELDAKKHNNDACPACGLADGEWTNGAMKCPECWHVWQ